MSTRAKEYDGGYKPESQPNSQNGKRIGKALTNITKLEKNQGSGPWAAAEVALLDKSLLELLRIFDKKDAADKSLFCAQNGFERIIQLLGSLINPDSVTSKNKKNEENKENPPLNQIQSNNKKNRSKSDNGTLDDLTDDSLSIDSHDTTSNIPDVSACVLPAKSVGLCAKVLYLAVKCHDGNSRHIVYSNLISGILDLLMQRLGDMKLKTSPAQSNEGSFIQTLPSDLFVTQVLLLLAELLIVIVDSDMAGEKKKGGASIFDSVWVRLQDVISYCVCVGVADKVSWYLSHVQGPAQLEADPGVGELILAAMGMLAAMAYALNCK